MKRIFLLVLFLILLSSCGSSKSTQRTKPSSKSESIVNYAKGFNGTRYKFGGTTTKGMDCSGLVYVSFKKEDILLPRISRDMAKKGKRIPLNRTRKGDLVFFKTNKNRNVINHVGLVVEIEKGDIYFIHSTTRRGVIISSLKEKYWKEAFVEVRSII
jgi:cell wall-associated NlpC family hydrolase